MSHDMGWPYLSDKYTNVLINIMHIQWMNSLSGAFVAGLDAGLSYNTWPKMADRWVPSDMFRLTPKWKNILENSAMVQFNHRHLVGATVTTAVYLV